MRRRQDPAYAGPRRRLEDKMAALPWDEGEEDAAIRRATEELPDYAEVLGRDLEKLRGLLAELEAAVEPPAETWRRIFRIAHDISGQAPSFRHPAAAAVGNSLERLLQPILKKPELLRLAANRRLRAVRTHVEALALLLEEGITDTSAETGMLIERLRLAVDRVRREERDGAP